MRKKKKKPHWDNELGAYGGLEGLLIARLTRTDSSLSDELVSRNTGIAIDDVRDTFRRLARRRKGACHHWKGSLTILPRSPKRR